MIGRQVRLAAAAAALLATGTAQAQDAANAPACFTPAEAQAAIQPVVSAGLAVLRKTCAPLLAPNAYLTSAAGNAMIERYEDASTAAFKSNREAVARLLQKDAATLTEADIPEYVDVLLGSAKLETESCTTVDRALALLDPLPPQNLVGLVTLLLEVGSKGGDKKGKPPLFICSSNGN